MAIPIARIIEKLDSYFKTNDLASARRLLDSWQEEAQSLGDFSGELSVVNELLGLIRRQNDSQNADRIIERALFLLQKTGSEKSVSGATVLVNAATTCKAFSKNDLAPELYKKAGEVYEKSLAPDDLRLAAFYNNYATFLSDTGQYQRALCLYKKAEAITKNKKPLDCAVTYMNMAHLYEKYEGIESEQIEKCLNLCEEILEQEQNRDSYYAFVLSKCAPSFDYFGFFFYANTLKERAEKIYEGA